MSHRRRLIFRALACSAPLLAFIARVECGEIDAYRELKFRSGIGVSSRIFACDPEFGFGMIPASVGSIVLTDRVLPARHDARGFRVPAAGRSPTPMAKALFLGCSYTYGWGVKCEDAFPDVASRELGLEPANGGGPGWGLAQMILRARREIPSLPGLALVVVQSSPWLSDRAQQRTSDGLALGGPCPKPYYAEGARIVAPQFWSDVTAGWDPADLAAPEGFLDYQAFCLRWGALACVRRDLAGIRLALARAPRAEPDSSEVLRAAYGELRAICRTRGVRLVVLRIRWSCTPRPNIERELAGLAAAAPLEIVDATEAARGELEIPFDGHPSEAGHALIARTLVRAVGH